MPIKKLDDLVELAKSKPKKRLITAYAHDESTIRATQKAIDLNLVETTLVGDKEFIINLCKSINIDHNIFEIVNEPDELKAGQKAIELINAGKGDVLMKGLISTDNLLRCVLNKENGLMKPKAILSHISIAEIPNYHKLLIFTDPAFIPKPDLKQKIALTNYVIDTIRKIGVEKPKVALVSISEKTNPKISSTVDAAIISKMADRGQIKNADVDGPLSVDLAISPKSLKVKNVKSCVEGNADGLVFPFIEAANAFFKSLTYFANAEIASYIVGTKVPMTLSSRSDSEKSKLYSIVFACLMAEEN
ncbi:MAG: hypothetical protein K8S23_01950 [Candidatus Cloacimonetes bacterium]|nr:hypothetical protein [Candidatus Cloacimonadota bacterium]